MFLSQALMSRSHIAKDFVYDIKPVSIVGAFCAERQNKNAYLYLIVSWIRHKHDKQVLYILPSLETSSLGIVSNCKLRSTHQGVLTFSGEFPRQLFPAYFLINRARFGVTTSQRIKQVTLPNCTRTVYELILIHPNKKGKEKELIVDPSEIVINYRWIIQTKKSSIPNGLCVIQRDSRGT